MNDLNAREIFLNRLNDINVDQDLKEFKKQTTSLYRDFINHLTENEKQTFSGYFAKTVYCLDKYEYPDSLKNNFGIFNYLLKKSDTQEKRSYVSNYLNSLIQYYFEPQSLSVISDISFEYRVPDLTNSIKCVVLRKGSATEKEAELTCYNDELGKFKLILNDQFLIYSKILIIGFNAFLVNIKIVSDEEILVQCTKNTIIVFEPDLLLDVTDVAECFQMNSYNVNLHFLKLFSKKQVTEAIFKGNMINYFFDRLIFDPDVEFDTVFQEALNSKPLSVKVLRKYGLDPESLKTIVYEHFENLQMNIEHLGSDKVTVEPTFISPVYGLQGRLDALVEFDDPKRKDVIELKSGKPAGKNLTVFDADGTRIPVGVWNNHLAQTSCYNLLLDSTFDERKGASSILYSKDTEFPFRNVPNINKFKWEAIECRNRILAYEFAISKGKFSVFDDIEAQKFGNRPPFVQKEIEHFHSIYSSLNDLERDYFHAFLVFLIRESFAQRSGIYSSNPESSFAANWTNMLDEEYYLDELKLDTEGSDLVQQHLKFTLSKRTISTFRKGDIVILVPDDEENSLIKDQILKSVIKEISEDHILISLRNKLTSTEKLLNINEWKIVKDHSDANLKRLYPYLFELFSSEKKDLLLGEKSGSWSEKKLVENDLEESQYELFRKAIYADDYFILQGPPGTGKTSYFLRNLIIYYLDNTESNVFITAYTNRAIDQICNTLDSAGLSHKYLRLGSKEGATNKDRLLSSLSYELDFEQLSNEIDNTRIVVSTLSSAISNNEIFEIKEFDICIVDEAAQILEVQLSGFLSMFHKFILIGDEKQLPAITVQKEELLQVRSENLRSIHLNDLSSSLFERLLNLARTRGDDHLYGMLTKQARMDDPIMALTNHLFYDGNLSSMKDTNETSELVFMNTRSDKYGKVNTIQINAVEFLIKDLLQSGYPANEIGVIAPFRAQCNAIRNKIQDLTTDEIIVDTVERFQGSERSIIIISTTVNHPYQLKQIESAAELEGQKIDRKLNVAITRAKEKLFILGNREVLKHSPIYNKLIEFIEDNYRLINFEDVIDQGIENVKT